MAKNGFVSGSTAGAKIDRIIDAEDDIGSEGNKPQTSLFVSLTIPEKSAYIKQSKEKLFMRQLKNSGREGYVQIQPEIQSAD